MLLISDLRFPNEFKAVKDLGGLCVKVTRDSVAKTDDIADNALDGETGWDHVINNDASMSDLRKDLWDKLKDYINDSNT